MQHGQVKHYNRDKGYGFISIHNQDDDVFFHMKQWRISERPQIGQDVYVSYQRNEKNQLRATQVSAYPSTSHSHSHSNSNSQPTGAPFIKSRKDKHRTSRQSASSKPTTKLQAKPQTRVSRILSLLAIVVAVIFGGIEVVSNLAQSDNNNNASIPTGSIDIVPATNKATNENVATVTSNKDVNRTIALIKQGGPFPYPAKDGTVFYNREGRLPERARGYYHEYTVPTPGISHRGAKRIVIGGTPPEVYYLTLDHYDSFRKLDVE